METPGVFFMVGKRPTCPKCVEGMIFREEISLTDVAKYKAFAAEPGMQCPECDSPVAREACAPAFEQLMIALAVLEGITIPPESSETPAEDDAVVKANEEVRRRKAEYAATYRELVRARNKVIAEGGSLGGAEPLPSE